jgi:serine/threonine protein kinase
VSAEENDAAAFVGRIVGGYRLIALLGRGGAGAVFLGERLDDPSVRRALKLLLPSARGHPSADPSFQARFLREAQVISQLRHPNILPLLGFHVESDGLAYMELPYIEGGTLASRLAATAEPLDLTETAGIIAEIATALDYAHGRGIVHRDMKPSNVLTDSSGRLLVADFGIAKALRPASHPDHPDTPLTGELIVGTPAYMAPEQVLGALVTPATDVYALGIMLYQCVTGRLPFQADTPMAVALMQVHDAVVPPRSFRPELPLAAEAAILLALAKRPEERFASAGALAEAFAQGLRGIAFEAPPALPVDIPLAPKPASASTAAVSPPDLQAAFIQARQPETPTDVATPPSPSRPIPPHYGRTPQTTDPAYGPRGRGRARISPLWIVIVLLALLVGVLLGNGRLYTISLVGAALGPSIASPTASTSTIQSTPTQPANPTVTVPLATPTRVVTYCTRLPDFASKGQPATGGANFADVPFPSSSLSYVAKTFSDGSYHFSLVSVCSPGLSSANLRSYFATAMPNNGWTRSSTYPYAGNPSRACGDSYCWTKGSGPVRYASLEAVQPGASGVTYQLRLGTHG